MVKVGDRLPLFEGIIMGIYGNWLISAVDKITFTQVLVVLGYPLWWYQQLCMICSFAFLILLVGLGAFRPRQIFRTRWAVPYYWILGVGHLVFILCALYVEGLSPRNLFFFAMGCILFFTIYSCELIGLRRNT